MPKAFRPYQLSSPVLERIHAERLRQMELQRAGKFTFTCAAAGIAPEKKYVVLAEEVGEVAQAVINLDVPGGLSESTDHFFKLRAERINHLRDELTQVAAVAVAWLESLEKEALSNHTPDHRAHLRRLRELEGRMLACQSTESEEVIQKQIDAEHRRWASVQQTNEKEGV